MNLAYKIEMPRFQCDPYSPYHVTSRCINKDWFSMPMPEVWNIFCTNLNFTNHCFKLRLHAFVLMSNHFHLLVTAPNGDLSKAMEYFIRETSRHITHDSHRINHTFARRFKRTRVAGFHYYFNTYKYIYQNPVRAHIVDRVEEYPYSSLRGLLGLGSDLLPIEDQELFEGTESTIQWLNRPVGQKNVRDMRVALRRGDFKPPAKSRKIPDIFSRLI